MLLYEKLEQLKENKKEAEDKQEKKGEPFVRQIHVIQNKIYDLSEEIEKLQYAWATLEEQKDDACRDITNNIRNIQAEIWKIERTISKRKAVKYKGSRQD